MTAVATDAASQEKSLVMVRWGACRKGEGRLESGNPASLFCYDTKSVETARTIRRRIEKDSKRPADAACGWRPATKAGRGAGGGAWRASVSRCAQLLDAALRKCLAARQSHVKSTPMTIVARVAGAVVGPWSGRTMHAGWRGVFSLAVCGRDRASSGASRRLIGSA